MTKINRFKALVKESTPISKAIRMMGSSQVNKQIAGIVIMVDDSGRVTGVITDGDVRRGLAKGIALDAPVSRIANTHPLTVDYRLSPEHMRRQVMDRARLRGANYLKFDKLILVRNGGEFYDVIRLSDIMESQVDEKIIAVYGLGFVGLTLACTLANAGLSVVGIDTDKKRVEQLKKGVAPFYEKGLDSLLSSLASTNPIHYTTKAGDKSADIHIVSVGSPVDAGGKPNLSDLKKAAKTIAGLLKLDDLVIFRSTVPAGTMRKIVLPILEESGLSCGKEFHLAFAPERTIEGNALEELRLLPQIVGGYNRAATAQTARLFRHITNTIIEVGSLEEAELVKLMNNTFRDLVFAFSNEVAAICDGFNINAFDIVRAANEGYPRDRIPLPSPGVGGICLSKDPYLYGSPMAKLSHAPLLGKASRDVNRQGVEQLYAKLAQFAKASKQTLGEMDILIVGVAFKGMPETSDIRASIALRLLDKLPNRKRVRIKDFVVPAADIRTLGCSVVEKELADALKDADAVLFMNNHYRNNKFNVIQALRGRKKPLFFFDGWNMFNQRELESLTNVCYATPGYMTASFRG